MPYFNTCVTICCMCWRFTPTWVAAARVGGWYAAADGPPASAGGCTVGCCATGYTAGLSSGDHAASQEEGQNHGEAQAGAGPTAETCHLHWASQMLWMLMAGRCCCRRLAAPVAGPGSCCCCCSPSGSHSSCCCSCRTARTTTVPSYNSSQMSHELLGETCMNTFSPSGTCVVSSWEAAYVRSAERLAGRQQQVAKNRLMYLACMRATGSWVVRVS
jgi:hypothetical protein